MSKKYDDDRDSPYHNLEKSTVLQEARVFNEYPVNPKKCRIVLTKIILVLQSQPLQRQEATNLFFSITKLFQCPDVSLRQTVYLAIKELATISDDVMMVTQSLTKDINSKQDVVYRSNAIRALSKITQPSDVQAIERFMKQSIVDRNSSVSSAALVSALHLSDTAKDIVKRWANEAQEALNSKAASTQYHALGLLYHIRQNDKMAIMKLIQQYGKGALRSPHAICMLIRYAWKLLDEEPGNRTLYDVLESFLRHKSDMVVYEAARAICHLRDVTAKELFPAVSALQLLLVNHKTTLRFAAIRTMNTLALTHPESVSVCNLDLENLITDTNRSISTFAITTLLKTGNEASVDRLMKQISGFMGEIGDDFKVIVVDAVRALCLKFPQKHVSMLTFLKDCLRDEGGYEFKKSVVEAVFDIIHAIGEAKEVGLEYLCEFIEDCDYAKLAVRVLSVLGREGPRTGTPSKYIRYIYNRVILENAVVRAAAVSALAQFANLDSERERIRVLLKRCTLDTDDEVRDRATFYLRILSNGELATKYVKNEERFVWSVLENKLLEYLERGVFDTCFDIQSVPKVSKDEEMSEQLKQKEKLMEMATGTIAVAPAETKQEQDKGRKIGEIDQLKELGPVFKSSERVLMSEQEEEYVVSCVKHILDRFVIFEVI
jgi:coatomer subunit gamma